ncbi:potassium channel family protein [Cohnella caldifontis]|uniref:potassium channel family protein n=1 Tax=Cohnella caldifontis TaxID=3027471 RepID=UPI0023EAD34A|nr:potassium channel family protein [Cohnella sp. YIM B05605]
MISFAITLGRLLKGIVKAFREKEFQVLFLLVALMLLSGTLFYVKEEGLSVLDALYFCVTTLSTVGHPDFEPKSPLGKAFTMIYIAAGTGLFFGLLFDLAKHILGTREPNVVREDTAKTPSPDGKSAGRRR